MTNTLQWGRMHGQSQQQTLKVLILPENTQLLQLGPCLSLRHPCPHLGQNRLGTSWPEMLCGAGTTEASNEKHTCYTKLSLALHSPETTPDLGWTIPSSSKPPAAAPPMRSRARGGSASPVAGRELGGCSFPYALLAWQPRPWAFPLDSPPGAWGWGLLSPCASGCAASAPACP